MKPILVAFLLLTGCTTQPLQYVDGSQRICGLEINGRCEQFIRGKDFAREQNAQARILQEHYNVDGTKKLW